MVNINQALSLIEQADPVANFAEQLDALGFTEKQLFDALGDRAATPIGKELTQKFLEVIRGIPTINQYGKVIQ